MKEIIDYKEQLLKEIWSNQQIKDLMMDEKNTKINYNSFRKYVIPYSKRLETIKVKGSYILFDVDVLRIKNSTVADYGVNVWIIVSDDLLETSHGIRVDLLASEFDKMLNGNINFGIGKLDLQNALSFGTPSGFIGRKLSYLSKDFNRIR